MTTSMLNKRDWIDFVPKNEGQTVGINHHACGDTRGRLYITNKGNGLALAYCQNCQRPGVHSTRTGRVSYDSAVSILDGKKVLEDGTEEIVLPSDINYDIDTWPVEGRVWVRKYGITDDELSTYGIGYSDSIKRLVIPVYDKGKLYGYQGRALFNGQKPKYLTCVPRKSRAYFISQWHPSNTLVVVEDALSCIKVGRVTNALALGSTHMPQELVDRLADMCYTDIVVWLDNDNIEVKKAMLKIVNQLSPLFNVHLITSLEGVDPKELSTEKIKEVLNE